jgi:hypothetical protein
MPIVEIYDKPGVGRRLRIIKPEDLQRRGVRIGETPGELVKLHHNFYSSRAADGYVAEAPPPIEPPAPEPAPSPEPSPPPPPPADPSSTTQIGPKKVAKPKG